MAPATPAPNAPSRKPVETREYTEIEIRNIVDRVLFRTGLEDPATGTPVFVLNSTALPPPQSVSYSDLLPHLLAVVRHVGDYSVIFFAGGGSHRPSWPWMIQTYSSLERDLRKSLKRLYIVHENWWVRTIMEMVAGAVSGKFRNKAVHVPNLTALAQHLDIRFVSIPLAVYVHDRKLEPKIEFETQQGVVFGRDLPSEGVVPYFWRECIEYLSVEGIYTPGIFRISPKLDHLSILREAFDRCQVVDLHDYGPHVIASLLKLFLRLLPTPPLPYSLMDKFPDFTGNAESTIIVANSLPRQTIILCSFLVPLLRSVALHERSSKMTITNLAKCITPSLVRIAVPTEETAILSPTESGTTLVPETSSETVYISDPMEVVRVLEYNTKLFECLIYYWTELPFVSGSDASNGKDKDGDSKITSSGRTSSSTTLKSLGHLPPPLPSRKPSTSSSSSSNTGSTRMESDSSAALVSSTATPLSADASTSSAGASPSPSPQLSDAAVPSIQGPPAQERVPRSLSTASSTPSSGLSFSYSTKQQPQKAVALRKATPLGQSQSQNTQLISGRRGSATSTFSYSSAASSSTSSRSSSSSISSSESDKPYIPLPTTTFLPAAGTSTRSLSTPIKTTRVSVVGGFRCISADSQQHAQVLRAVSPYVTAQAYSIKPEPKSTTDAAGAGTVTGKENAMLPPVLPPKVKVTRPPASEGLDGLIGRKKGRIVEELTRIYEERSQSAELLVQMGKRSASMP
ncbi:hypothetical protein POJ06DRAFT_35823 [Lipomyces tetrasporus]|uniref:Rho-GAP domain-containing protein n=1 Tax=Lipomyces tetrasporus TaxID=54092 RepID=A0AAD7QLQ9_9ASCO|nr:uncharacterized protein POJ06DRAFT_35823 [Lipomyces tetrasporus]KAJ8097617.1 hypothetical protein POJ06DRAFT_35823 [Lipomyces tetrasporus]